MWPTEEEPWFGCFVKEQADDLELLGVSVQVVKFDGRRDSLEYLRAGRKIRDQVRRERYGLVHAHYGLTGAVAMMQRRVPVVTTFHGSDTGYIPWQRPVSWVVARRTTPIFVSRFAAGNVNRPGAAVIPAPVDTTLFVPSDRKAARQQLGWDPSRRYVLLPGARGNLRKRADLFDAAVREAQRQAPELTPVSLEGFSRHEASLVMNAVDVTLMTSDWEGSPVAVRESLACNTPVVSVPVADVPEVLADLPGCWIAREPVDLARHVIEALEAPRDPALRRRAEETSRIRMTERLLDLYGSVVKGERRDSSG